MIERQLATKIKEMQGKYPVITITGPRQSGKTTLIKSLFPDIPYFSMETPDLREQVMNNPRELFARYGHSLVLDEVQRTPEILSYIQTIVDEDPAAFFILSGSHNMLMMENISQSLAGRTAIFYLLPLSLAELEKAGFSKNLRRMDVSRLYPRLYDRDLQPSAFSPNYLETYVQRDVPTNSEHRQPEPLHAFFRFAPVTPVKRSITPSLPTTPASA
ncbi:MAG: AAA family ATPase [Saprospiraceae bacterium]|nr:AAA family ATPase [Saprospiraceae bacterium]